MFAPYHGYSLCDAHGGNLKKNFHRWQSAMGVGVTTAAELVAIVQEKVASNVFANDTSAFVYDPPAEGDENDDFFPAIKALGTLAQNQVTEAFGGIQKACCACFDYNPPTVKTVHTPVVPREIKGIGVFELGIFRIANTSDGKGNFYFFDLRPGAPKVCRVVRSNFRGPTIF